MEESFVTAAPTTANTHNTNENHENHGINVNALELRRWQQWRDTDPAGLNTTAGIGGTGSAARPIEIDGAAADTTPNGGSGRREGLAVDGAAGRQGGNASLEEQETLWGHAVHEHDLSPGDQVRHACVVANRGRDVVLPALILFFFPSWWLHLRISLFVPEDLFCGPCSILPTCKAGYRCVLSTK